MFFLKEYTLLGELGVGGFAKVYKVRHNELGYIRAIRVLNETVTDGNSPAYQKFLRECKVLLRLGNGSHRNIVHIYQPRLLENHALVEMDYVDGKDIARYLEDNGRFLPVEEVVRMAEEISSALAYCHEDIYKFCIDPDGDKLENDPLDGSKWLIDETTRQRLIEKYKVIHNDIHSGNIMRREDGSFVLLDFGLAITGSDDVRNSSRHENGAIEFKAPEKWEDDSILTEQSDIYSFGVVMFEYLAGQVPFPFDKTDSNKIKAAFMLGEAHKNQTPPSIFGLRKAFFEATHPGQTYEKDYPDWLEDAVLKCLEKDPAKRFRNGKELHEFIKKNLEETPAESNTTVALAEENKDLIEQNDETRHQLEQSEETVKQHEKTIEKAKKHAVVHLVVCALLAIAAAALGWLYLNKDKTPSDDTSDVRVVVDTSYLDSIAKLQQQVTSLKGQLKSANNSAAQAQSLADDLKNQVTNLNDSLNEQITTLNGQINTLNGQIASLNQENDKLKAQPDSSKKIKELEDKLSAAEALRDKYKNERDKYKNERDTYKSERDTYKSERDSYKKDRDKLKNQLDIANEAWMDCLNGK